MKIDKGSEAMSCNNLTQIQHRQLCTMLGNYSGTVTGEKEFLGGPTN